MRLYYWHAIVEKEKKYIKMLVKRYLPALYLSVERCFLTSGNGYLNYNVPSKINDCL